MLRRLKITIKLHQVSTKYISGLIKKKHNIYNIHIYITHTITSMQYAKRV